MRHVLASDNRAALARIMAMPSLCAFDFDGTLAPFVAAPDRAAMRGSTRQLFVELAASRLCAIVSGRSRDDVLRRCEGARLVEVIGNHGIEPIDPEPRFAAHMRDVHKLLADALDPVAGVHIEDKTYTLAVHYRHAPDRSEAREAIHVAVSRLKGVRALGGELVVNVVPMTAPNKGDALLALATKLGVPAALYIGDDETDEDVFALAGATGLPSPHAPVELFTVRVGYSHATRAQYFLEHQDEIDLFLSALIRESAFIKDTAR